MFFACMCILGLFIWGFVRMRRKQAKAAREVKYRKLVPRKKNNRLPEEAEKQALWKPQSVLAVPLPHFGEEKVHPYEEIKESMEASRVRNADYGTQISIPDQCPSIAFGEQQPPPPQTATLARECDLEAKLDVAFASHSYDATLDKPKQESTIPAAFIVHQSSGSESQQDDEIVDLEGAASPKDKDRNLLAGEEQHALEVESDFMFSIEETTPLKTKKSDKNDMKAGRMEEEMKRPLGRIRLQATQLAEE